MGDIFLWLNVLKVSSSSLMYALIKRQSFSLQALSRCARKKLGSRVYRLLHQPSYFERVSTNTNETMEPILNTFTVYNTYKPK